MATKLSVVDILEARYIEFIETVGKDPENFYMNLDMLFILYNEVMVENTEMKLSWEDAKRDGLYYRGINVSITESTFLGEVIAL
tara:strand:- start:808 stop:1059 length:252 start_codon:yes stop_codon:yes gene_type:complete